MTNLHFTKPTVITTPTPDKTPRAAFYAAENRAFHAGQVLIVHVATEQPEQPLLAGRVIVQTLGPINDGHKRMLQALSIHIPVDTGQREWDVPNHVWIDYVRRLRSLGADLSMIKEQ